MKAVLCWLALGAVPALGQAGGGPVAPFALYSEFEQPPGPPVLNSVKSELTAILSSAGVPVEWRSLDADHGKVSHELAVVRFKGNCSPPGVFEEQLDERRLGWTYLIDGNVLPFSDVDCDRIRAFLSRALLHFPEEERAGLFGRAVARVVAHELYHILMRTRHHSGWGLAEASYTVDELLADEFSFDETDQRELGARVATWEKGAKATGRSLFAASGCSSCHGAEGQGAEAPALRSASQQWKASQLAARLANKASAMYRTARGLGALWRPLAKRDIETLVAYLNTSDN